MSLTGRERHLLDNISTGLARSDPDLERLMWTFGQLAVDEQMPAREQIRGRWRRTACARSRRRPSARPRSGRTVIAGRVDIGIGGVVILIWVLVSAVLISLGVAMGGGHTVCRDVSVAGCLSGRTGSLPELGRSATMEDRR